MQSFPLDKLAKKNDFLRQKEKAACFEAVARRLVNQESVLGENPMRKLIVLLMMLFLAGAGATYTTGCNSNNGNSEKTTDGGTTKDAAAKDDTTTKDDSAGNDKPTSRPAP